MLLKKNLRDHICHWQTSQILRGIIISQYYSLSILPLCKIYYHQPHKHIILKIQTQISIQDNNDEVRWSQPPTKICAWCILVFIWTHVSLYIYFPNIDYYDIFLFPLPVLHFHNCNPCKYFTKLIYDLQIGDEDATLLISSTWTYTSWNNSIIPLPWSDLSIASLIVTTTATYGATTFFM